MNTYEYTFKTDCPNDGEKISYQLTIESPDMIMAEHIVETCNHIQGYQEYIAGVLKEKIGGKIQLIGTHSGVKITTVL